jgi:HEAT repeat protein
VHSGRTSRARRAACCVAAAIALWLLAAWPKVAGASDGERKAAGGAAAGLLSEDPARAAAAVDALGKRGDRAAVAALTAFLRAGQPDALTDRGLLALGATRSPDALAVLAEFTHHRRTAARAAAHAGAARIPGAAADALLAEGLRDSDAGVRGSCARALAERGAKSQLDLLFRAFVRGVPEASFALGKLAEPASLPRFEEQLGRLPIQVMLAGYEQFLLRPDIDEATKVELVAHLGEVASLTVKRFLERLLAAQNWASRPRLLRALAETARRIVAPQPAAGPQPVPSPPGATP